MIPACLTHTQSEHVKLNVVQLAAKDEYVAAARTAGRQPCRWPTWRRCARRQRRGEWPVLACHALGSWIRGCHSACYASVC